nr:hypothetical protein [FCB group bacterium]
AVVAIPKFFDIRESAHYEVKTRVIGVIKSGLANYGNNETSVNQERSYPATAALTLEMIMDEIPDKWTYNPGTGAITYSGDNSTWLYTSPVGGDASLYTLILQ